jgi:hypothetical protein
MDEDNEYLPRSVGQQRRGWQGEESEIDHQRESLNSGKDKDVVAAAVDIRKFQNHLVGEGYQAKHVIRQASAKTTGPSLQIKDMSGGAKFGRGENKQEMKDTGDRNYIQNGNFEKKSSLFWNRVRRMAVGRGLQLGTPLFCRCQT